MAVAEKNRQRATVAAVREQERRQRAAERAGRESDRLQQQAQRTGVAADRAMDIELRQARIAAQESAVEELNGELALQLEEIDNLLGATLEVDDYVDLQKLRQTANHPQFQSAHNVPVVAPTPIEVPPEPVFTAPEAPRGMGAVFGKKKHAEAVAAAQGEHEFAHRQWQQAAAAVPMRQLAQLAEHQQAEQARDVLLAADRVRYDAECAARQDVIDANNDALDQLIADLGRGAPEAVEDYLGIVFGNSVYPADWPWPPEYSYDPQSQELSIAVQFPAPEDIPTARAFKYVRAKDEITRTDQTLKEQRQRYTGLVHAMTLRTMHEVWEADRGRKVSTISLVGSTTHIDPATGRDTMTPLIAVAADRATFETIDLSRVAPAETLRHLGAVLSKNPQALTPIKLAPGVRAI